MKYYSEKQAFMEDIHVITQLERDVNKGFSMEWSNPLKYNKIPEELHEFFVTYPEKYGLYYAEMISLNLRGV